MVNQFSGVGLSHSNNRDLINLSLKNLRNKIDLLFDIEDFFILLNWIISSYNLPNLFFQKQQVNYNKINISKKTIEKIKKYNEQDIILYSKLLQNNLIKNCNKKTTKDRNIKKYLYSSPELLVNNKKTLLLNENEIQTVEKKLIKSNYEIQKV